MARQVVARRSPDPPGAARTPRRPGLAISGYHGEPTVAALVVATFDPAQRMRRAVKALAGFWGAMAVSVFIPIAHFLLVPSFFGIGIWQFFRRLRMREQVRGVHGWCPDCGAEQDFELSAGSRVPQGVMCRNCHRGLTLAARGISSGA